MSVGYRMPSFWVLHLALMLGHILVLFNAAIYVAAIPKAAGALGVAPSFGTWAQTYYMMGWALAVPLANWWGMRFGQGRILLAGLAGFILASMICAWAQEFPLFLLGRILLGFPGGLILLLTNAVALSQWPSEKRLTMVVLWGMVGLTPLTLGGAFGGWLIDEWGWRWLFYLNIPLAAGVLLVLAWLLPCMGGGGRVWRFDWLGYILLVGLMAGTHTLLNLGNDWDWWNSGLLTGVAFFTMVAFVFMIIWELGTPYPAVDLRLPLRQRNVLIGIVCLAVGFFFIQGLFSFTIVRLQLIFGYETWLAGLVFLPLLLSYPMVALNHWLMRWVDLRLLITLDLLGLSLAFFWFGHFDRRAWLDQLHWPMALEGIFLGFFFAPLTALIMTGVPHKHQRRVLEQVNIFRLAAGSWGISSMGVIAYFRTAFHRANFADFFAQTPFLPFGQDRLTQFLSQRASILGFDDPFLVAADVFVLLAGLVWLANPAHLPVRLRWHSHLRWLRQLGMGQAPLRIALIMVLFISGCAGFPGEEDEGRFLSQPTLTHTLEAAAGSAPLTGDWPRRDWWRVLGNPQLSHLVELALRDQPDLKVVAHRMEESQARVTMESARLLPGLEANVSLGHARFSANSVQTKLAGENFGFVLFNPANLHWHLDLWGKDRAAIAAAMGRSQARASELAQARVLLSTAVARAYLGLVVASRRLEVAKALAGHRQDRLAVMNVRWNAGLDPRMTMDTAIVREQEAQELIALSEQRMRLLRHQLAYLTGRGPDAGEDIEVLPLVLTGRFPLPANLPLRLIAHRPDVAVAKHLAQAAAQEVKVARTEFFPDVNIRGFAGFHSVAISDILFQGSSLAYQIGPTLELPLFKGGLLRGNLRARQAAYSAAVETYNQTVLRAVQEVADAVTRWQEANRRRNESGLVVTAARHRYRLTLERYHAGLIGRAKLHQSAAQVAVRELEWIDLQLVQQLALVDLIEALGGGWNGESGDNGR